MFLQRYTHCLISVIFKIKVTALVLKLMDWINSPVCQIEGVFLFTNGKMSWMLTGAVSLETVLLGTQEQIVKMDGFESSSNIIHIV